MDSNDISIALIEAGRESLEKMTFSETELKATHLPGNTLQISTLFNSCESQLIWCSIEIHLPEIQKFYLVLEEVLGGKFAKRMLGIEDARDVTTSEIIDSISELTNVLTGKYCQQKYGDNSLYKLGIPEFGTGLPDISIFNSYINVHSSEGMNYLVILSEL